MRDSVTFDKNYPADRVSFGVDNDGGMSISLDRGNNSKPQLVGRKYELAFFDRTTSTSSPV